MPIWTVAPGWIRLITLYEIVVGMKLTLGHLLHYKPVIIRLTGNASCLKHFEDLDCMNEGG